MLGPILSRSVDPPDSGPHFNGELLRIKSVSGSCRPLHFLHLNDNLITSGLRIGTPASTTRGFKEAEIEQVADFIVEVLDAEGSEAAIERVRPKVVELCRRFPVYGS